MATFLADIFENLASDPSWPWTIDTDPQKRLNIKFNMAKLAVMVVSAAIEGTGTLVDVLLAHGINFDHYANVKKRVEEAEEK